MSTPENWIRHADDCLCFRCQPNRVRITMECGCIASAPIRYCALHAAAPATVAALERAAATFADFVKVSTLLGRLQFAEAARIAEMDARAAIAKTKGGAA